MAERRATRFDLAHSPTACSPLPSSRSRVWPTATGSSTTEIKDLDRQLTRLVETPAPRLVARRGIGIHTAATLLVTAGDKPDRLASEQSFAALAGTLPASSGPRQHHRLNRGGDRDANAALHMIAINRLANRHEPALAYVHKRTGSNKADLDTIRRIKRYIAREVFPLLRDILNTRSAATLECSGVPVDDGADGLAPHLRIVSAP